MTFGNTSLWHFPIVAARLHIFFIRWKFPSSFSFFRSLYQLAQERMCNDENLRFNNNEILGVFWGEKFSVKNQIGKKKMIV